MKKLLYITFIISALAFVSCDDDNDYDYDYYDLYYDSEWSSSINVVMPDGSVQPGFRILDLDDGRARITDYDTYGYQLYPPVYGTYSADFDYDGQGTIWYYGDDGTEQWNIVYTRTHLLNMPNPWGLVLLTPNQDEAFYPGDIFDF